MVRRTDDQQDDAPTDLAGDFLKDGWARTAADMRAMAEDREGKGYETLTLAADDTAAIAPEMGDEDDDRWGFSHLVPGDDAAAFREAFVGGDFTETGVYQSQDSGHVFMVTEHVDHDDETIVYIAASYRMADAAGLVRAAVDRGRLHTYVRKLDRTIVGTFEHDDVEAFFPNPDVYTAYEPGSRR